MEDRIINPPPVVSAFEADEQQLIAKAKEAVSSCNWSIGLYANEWVKRYARGRTDSEFAAEIGMSREHVSQCRRIHDRFSNLVRTYQHLTWTHYREALGWADAEDCLCWASDNQASVAEMTAWRNSKHGIIQTPKKLAKPVEHKEDTPIPEPADLTRARQAVKPNRRSEPGREDVAETASATTPAPAERPVVEAPSDLLRRLADLLQAIESRLSAADKAKTAIILRQWADTIDPPAAAASAKKKLARKFVPPTVDEVGEYCRERKNAVDPEQFVAFYQAKGWKVGNQPMKDWRAAVITWEKRGNAHAPKDSLSVLDSFGGPG